MTDAAARMDRMYRFQRHIYDLTRRPYLIGRMALVDGLAPPSGGSVLEVGCGTAWNLVRVARTYPSARSFGIDVSPAMLATARRRIAAAGLADRIALAAADATNFDTARLFGVATFDRVVLSYTLSMIPAWTLVLSRALDHVAADGELHVVDFGDGQGLPSLARAGLHAWLARFDVTPRAGLERELARLSGARGRDCTHADILGGYAQRAIVTRR